MLGNPLKWMIWGYPHSWKLSTRRIIESWRTVCQKLHRLRIVSMLSRRSTAEDQPRGRYGAGSWETCGIVGPLVSLISLLRSTSKHHSFHHSLQDLQVRQQILQDLDLRERLTAETDLARDTLGNKKRAAREA